MMAARARPAAPRRQVNAPGRTRSPAFAGIPPCEDASMDITA